jgi:hypothetical protein
MEDLDALVHACRTDLVALIGRLRTALAQAQATIEQVEARVAALETQVQATAERPGGSGGPPGMPGHTSRLHAPPSHPGSRGGAAPPALPGGGQSGPMPSLSTRRRSARTAPRG